MINGRFLSRCSSVRRIADRCSRCCISQCHLNPLRESSSIRTDRRRCHRRLWLFDLVLPHNSHVRSRLRHSGHRGACRDRDACVLAYVSKSGAVSRGRIDDVLFAQKKSDCRIISVLRSAILAEGNCRKGGYEERDGAHPPRFRYPNALGRERCRFRLLLCAAPRSGRLFLPPSARVACANGCSGGNPPARYV
jgi:hypothetical protein